MDAAAGRENPGLGMLDGDRCTLHLFGRSPASEEGNSNRLEDLTDTFGNWTGPPNPNHDNEGHAILRAQNLGLIARGDRPGMLELATGLSAGHLRALLRERSENTIVKSQCVAYVRDADSPVTPLVSGPPAPDRLGDFDPGSGVGVVSEVTVCPFIKMRVAASQWTGPVLIDCDRQLTVPAPHACVQAVARPRVADGFPGWRDVGSMGYPYATLTGQVWDVFLWIKICHARSFPGPFPIVTEWDTPANMARTMFTRPRAARTLFISAQNAAQTWNMFADRSLLLGTIQVPANQVLAVHTLPGFASLQSPVGDGNTTYTIAWDVQP